MTAPTVYLQAGGDLLRFGGKFFFQIKTFGKFVDTLSDVVKMVYGCGEGSRYHVLAADKIEHIHIFASKNYQLLSCVDFAQGG